MLSLIMTWKEATKTDNTCIEWKTDIVEILQPPNHYILPHLQEVKHKLQISEMIKKSAPYINQYAHKQSQPYWP